MSFSRYTLTVLAVASVSLAALFPIVGASLDGAGRGALLLGAGLAAANTLVAYALALWAEGRSTSAFLAAVLGGMLGRMGLLLASVLIAVVGFELPRVPLVVSLLGYFVVFLVIELAVLQKRPTPQVLPR